MANNATLIAAIRAAIKANGNQEITGDQLQAQLVNIINALSVGYQFVGLATPSTSHGSPDARVFYLAPPDTYRNFGASNQNPYTVPSGCIGIFRWDTAWTRETLDVVTAAATFGVCSANANVVAKTVAATDFELVEGAQFRVQFTNVNTATDPTLNIGGTGAKPIMYDGAAASATNSWEAGETVLLYYDGTNWVGSNAQGGGGKFATGEMVKYTAVTDDVEESSDALVTSGGVAQSQRDMVRVEYDGDVVFDNSAIQSYIRQNVVVDGTTGRLGSNNKFDSLVCPVDAGKKYRIVGLKNADKNDADVGNVWFYSGDPSSSYTVIGSVLADLAPDMYIVVDVPDGAEYMAMCIAARDFTPSQGGDAWNFDSASTLSLDEVTAANLHQEDSFLTEAMSIAHVETWAKRSLSNADIQQYILPNTVYQINNEGRLISSDPFDTLLLPVTGGATVRLTGMQNNGYIQSDPYNTLFYTGPGTGLIGGIKTLFDGTIHEIEFTVPEECRYIATVVRCGGYQNLLFDSTSTIAADVMSNARLVDNRGNYIPEQVMRRKMVDYALSNADLQQYIETGVVINGANGAIGASANFDTLIMPVKGGSIVTLNGLKWYGYVSTDIGEIWFYKGARRESLTLVSYLREEKVPDVPVTFNVPDAANWVGVTIAARNFTPSGQSVAQNWDADATVNAFIQNGNPVYTIWGTPTGEEIQKKLANSGGGGSVSVGAQGMDMGLPRDVPKVYVESELLTVVKDGQGNPTNQITPLTAQKNTVGDLDEGDVIIRFVSDGLNFEDAITIAYQGQSSLGAAKKNFSIDMKHKHRFGRWLPMDGFHLKGYNSDWLHIRDILANRIYEQILQTRPPEERRPFCAANDFSSHSVPLLTESGILCHVDGFPIELYINGDYWGVYSWNLKKHRSNYHLGKNDVANIQIDPNWQTMTPAGWDWTKAEVRNPKSDSGNTEFIEGTVPNNGEVKTWVSTFLSRLASITAGMSVDTLGTMLNVNNWVDVILFEQFIGGWDVFNRNNLYTTWNGNLLSVVPYDHDASFGIGLSSGGGQNDHVGGDVVIAPSYDVFTRAYTYCPWLQPLLTVLSGLLRDRYAELREAGVFTYDNVKGQVNAWTMQIGYGAYQSDLARWTYEGYGASSINPGFYDSANRILEWIEARIAYLDNLYGF